MQPVVIHNSTFYTGDCISGAAEHIADNSVDLIITDPPYGINGDMLHRHYNRNEDFVVDGYVEIPRADYADFSIRWIQEADRVLRPGGSIYIVSGYTNLIDLLNALKRTTLKEVNHIIWKYNFGVFTRRKFVSSHYHILFYEKPGGKRTFNLESRYGLNEKTHEGRSLNNFDREDVWTINREFKPGKVKNKNELPTKLLIKMIQYSSNEGDLIADFFCGGFSTAAVALGLNRRFVGFEISRQIFDAKIQEIQDLIPGYVLAQLQNPASGIPKNAKKTWTDQDIRNLHERFTCLCAEGMSRKQIVKRLCEDLGRGHWSIDKALKKNGLFTKKRSPEKKDTIRRG
jgi:site-specific DNA-methyltransferase (adenine-specific)